MYRYYRLILLPALVIPALAVLLVSPGCGEQAVEKPGPDLRTGQPQVVNFWQPG